MKTISKYFYHKYVKQPKKWNPILSVYYLTYDCDFRCPYCSDGSGMPYYKLDNKIADKNRVLNILAEIRKYCNYLVITGGEPLNHTAFGDIISNIKYLKFKNTILTTNGFYVEKYLDQISSSVNTLIFSIDTIDSKKADEWYGKGNGVFQKILDNIDLADSKNKKYEIIVSSVVTPDNIPDLYDVFKYCKERNFIFGAAPQLMGVKANLMLQKNEEYRKFYDFIINEKKKGYKVFGTTLYLEYMRDLRKFGCNPFTMLVVSPDGEVFYPCLEIGKNAGNMLENRSLDDLKNNGEKIFGPKPDCGNQCHSSCALGFALILKNPTSIINESLLNLKSKYLRN